MKCESLLTSGFFILRCCYLTLCFLFLSANVNASSIKQVGINELIEQSELVFEGRVVSSDVRWNDTKTLIKTFITFEVDEVISGDYPLKTLELSFIGGKIGNNNVEAKGLRQPAVGEKGIYFVRSLTQQLVNPLVGWSQGQFLLKKDKLGKDVVMTDAEHPIIGLRKASTRSSDLHLSEGVASDVMLSSDKSESDSAMSAAEFKDALKVRMKSVNK